LKTVRVSDETHNNLTRLLCELIAKTGKAQTFNDVIEDLIAQKDESKTYLAVKIPNFEVTFISMHIGVLSILL